MPSVATLLRDHVTLEVESIDRLYLNGYVPQLQTEGGVVGFFRGHRRQPFVSSALMGQMTDRFVPAIAEFAEDHGVAILPFEAGQRKDDVAKEQLAAYPFDEGVVFIGKAQEKAMTYRTAKRRNSDTGQSYPWIYRGSTFPNHYYFYLRDRDFGPLFVKFCSYFPYTMRVCLNGHEYAKRQLDQEGIAYEALDNGFLSCADPARLQQICDGLDAAKIEQCFRKWLALLPHPFSPEDQRAGYRYELSILQAEFSLTQVFERPLQGRQFFEEMIRENLDLGRPDRVQLVFGRRVTKRTPGRFRTRVLTEGVQPSLHIDYKHSKVKQYYKEGRGLRTETTMNDTRDFQIGKRLGNLPALRQIGFATNRRLLDVQQLSQDCMIGSAALESLSRPQVIAGQRTSALRFGDPRVMALLQALCMFALLPQGFRNRTLRALIAQLLGLDPNHFRPGQMTYDLRRLRLHGLIQRVPKTQRYEVTRAGLAAALLYTKAWSRILRTGLALTSARAPNGDSKLQRAWKQLDGALDDHLAAARLAA